MSDGRDEGTWAGQLGDLGWADRGTRTDERAGRGTRTRGRDGPCRPMMGRGRGGREQKGASGPHLWRRKGCGGDVAGTCPGCGGDVWRECDRDVVGTWRGRGGDVTGTRHSARLLPRYHMGSGRVYACMVGIG
jgi:hypothetical protein